MLLSLTNLCSPSYSTPPFPRRRTKRERLAAQGREDRLLKVGPMKTLSPDEIECLVGARPSNVHPLDMLGYGYTSEGTRRFRAEKPDFLPQIVAHLQSVLVRVGVFPEGINRDDPGFKTFIYTDGTSFRISSMAEVGVSRYERVSTGPLSETEATHEYIRKVANPDYIHCASPIG